MTPRTEATVGCRNHVIEYQLPREPVDNLRTQPTDPAASELPTLRKAAQPFEAGDHEPRAAGEPSHIVRAQEFVEGWRGLVDPARQGHFPTPGRRYGGIGHQDRRVHGRSPLV